jgi:large subunit ribosomal protein L13
MGTYNANAAEVERRWLVVDATDKPLGRLASRVAAILKGKHKATFTKHADAGDFVIVINADKVKLTGAKLDKKEYITHSGIPGGFKAEPYGKLLQRKPELLIEKAVKGMLPNTPLHRQIRSKLKVYAGPTHPHTAQKPEVLEL